ncbi:HTH-23 multi-domain protein, partial [Pyrenophora tritici-repentis]
MAPNTDSYTRTLIVTLKSPPVGKSTSQISELTGVHPRTVDRIYSRAIAAGSEPNVLPLKIFPQHVQDAPKPGRPAKQAEEVKEQ